MTEAKNIAFSSIQRGTIKGDFTVKGTGQSNVGSKISTFYLKDKMLILLDCDKLRMHKVIFRTTKKRQRNAFKNTTEKPSEWSQPESNKE